MCLTDVVKQAVQLRLLSDHTVHDREHVSKQTILMSKLSINPADVYHRGWGTFLLWGLFDLLIAAYSWFGLTETRGKTLEEISGRADHGRPTSPSSKVLSENGDRPIGVGKGPKMIVS